MWTLVGAAVFFFGSFALVPYLPTGFIPPDDLSQTQVTVTLPPGSTFKETYAAAEQAREIVQQNPYVKMIYTAIGGGSAGADPFAGGGAADVRTARADHQHDAPRRPQRRQQARHRRPAARGAGGRARARA